ncbi:hypothetical protein K493DRAFT_306241 [Basidiobolus meristosporus CBS 931.73]|uniref:EF-hand domain-containing protein n=1 Tax=Basidiobolus meristosporus CBS 931.73 TaxID=1314790 RepID=A0A1Y1XSY2_9FUNG|nr:hypothetical protein K493DRAFT_306241 [Basidiobolus meristosporus CBS 931.73]|eukprot:ORX88862.1 hypothetical protein K493DRAFT_306241 [Basidiobolus meristosporus CBS 931.73]
MSTIRAGYTGRDVHIKSQTASPLSTLHSNLEAIFTKFDKECRGSIVAQDLFPILNIFEREQGVILLDSEPKGLLQKFCAKNAEIELTPEDLYRLISQLSALPLSSDTTPNRSAVKGRRSATAPRPHSTLGFAHAHSPLASRQRTAPVTRALSTRKAAAEADKKRDIYVLPILSGFEDQRAHSMYSIEGACVESCSHFHLHKEITSRFTGEPTSYRDSLTEPYDRENLDRPHPAEKDFSSPGMNSNDAASQIGNLTRITLALNKRLQQTEKNLTLSVRQHEERISELQGRVDDMKVQLTARRREIQEYKSNERAQLQQICMLESEIGSISRVLSHHKNLYSDLRLQYDEKKEETEKLQLQLRFREDELLKGEMHLEHYAIGQKRYQQERAAFEAHISKLEQEISFAQILEHEVDELKEENQYLRGVVDGLRQDLDDALKGAGIQTLNTLSHDYQQISEVENEKNLHLELSTSEECSRTIGPTLECSEPREQESSYITYLKYQNQLFKNETEDASRKWKQAIHQLQGIKKSVALERQILQDEIDRLRKLARAPGAHQIAFQSIAASELCIITHNSNTDDDKAPHSTSGKRLGLENTQMHQEEFHQKLEAEYQKLINDFNVQESIIHQLLSEPANYVQTAQEFVTPIEILHRISAPRQSIARRPYGAISNPLKETEEMHSSDPLIVQLASKTRGHGTVVVILYTLVVYILGIVTSMFLQQPILDNRAKPIGITNSTALTWYPEHQQEQRQPPTQPLNYLIYWFQALAQGDELIQVPT